MANQRPPTPVATVLESGNLAFFYRPCPGVAHPRSSDQIEHVSVAMFPDDQIHHQNRLLTLAQGYFPPVIVGQDLPEERGRGYIPSVSHDPLAVIAALIDLGQSSVESSTARAQSCVRAAGDGRYLLLHQTDRTYLAYVLRQPAPLGPAQQTLMLDAEASFEVRIVEPAVPSELPIEGIPSYSPDLSERFDGHLSIPANPTDYLDCRWTRVFLVSAVTNLTAEFGVAPNPATQNDPWQRAFLALRDSARHLQAACQVDVLAPLTDGKLV
ncbi:MAG: hypothetical protein ACRDIY_19835 [Chloroflexota bacterium]